MTTADGLRVLYDQAAAAALADPDDRDLSKGFQAIRAAWLRQHNREQGIPDPPPPVPKSERKISMYAAVDAACKKLTGILQGDVLDRTLDELRGILDATPGPGSDRYRERLAERLDSLARRASAQSAAMRRSLP